MGWAYSMHRCDQMCIEIQEGNHVHRGLCVYGMIILNWILWMDLTMQVGSEWDLVAGFLLPQFLK
jgi:hypothetical protein